MTLIDVATLKAHLHLILKARLYSQPYLYHIIVTAPPQKGTTPIFGPCLLWVDGWNDQDVN